MPDVHASPAVLPVSLLRFVPVLMATAVAASAIAGDPRLGPPVTVDGDHPFTAVASPDAWAERSKLVRARVALAAGLLPMPARPPVAATIHGRVERDGYTI